ncbi:chorismate mutase [Kutzneria viridogrisea]|uniref:Chorismate mutase domain-containing protein n=2 Tax=Kutzneria TaxID=43356 RepID=W5WIU2_9PSEU|nr:chorismate mutase [Kutzneria albida]AHI00631.1 hypothetical protein KALB_7273 [Kutzneria albida DSM 43870]MBA8925810.1 chorismate mutase [Kutzneria viridogrisea]
MDVRSTSSLSRRAALTGFGGVALLAAAACSPSMEKPSDKPVNAPAAVPTPDPNASIAEQRKHIDELDQKIIELLKQRGEASATVQRVRTASGGAKTDPSREQEIISRYQEGLGANGSNVAKAILDVDRGTQAAGATSTTTTTAATPTSSGH